jgi:hypothetical protein
MPETLNINNVEETIEKAIQKYFDIGMIIDGIFWRNAINLLKKKMREEESE